MDSGPLVEAMTFEEETASVFARVALVHEGMNGAPAPVIIKMAWEPKEIVFTKGIELALDILIVWAGRGCEEKIGAEASRLSHDETHDATYESLPDWVGQVRIAMMPGLLPLSTSMSIKTVTS